MEKQQMNLKMGKKGQNINGICEENRKKKSYKPENVNNYDKYEQIK